MQKREHRLAIYQELTGLLAAGTTQSEAARQLGLGLRTVQRWLACGVFPERKHRVFPSIVDPYGPHLERRYREGCRNITVLWQELKERGFEGQCSTVRSWLRQRFGSPKKAMATSLVKISIPIGHQRIAWLMLKADPLRNRYLKALYCASPEIAEIASIARGPVRDHSQAGRCRLACLAGRCRKVTLCTLRSAPPARSGRRRRGVAVALEQWNGRGADSPFEADQTADVWPRRLRSTQAARTSLGLTSASANAIAITHALLTKSEPKPR
jgi:hypothetical protein